MYILDNYDVLDQIEREEIQRHKHLKRIANAFKIADQQHEELPFITVPMDYGTHENLY